MERKPSYQFIDMFYQRAHNDNKVEQIIQYVVTLTRLVFLNCSVMLKYIM